jgi:hypothetical protein
MHKQIKQIERYGAYHYGIVDSLELSFRALRVSESPSLTSKPDIHQQRRMLRNILEAIAQVNGLTGGAYPGEEDTESPPSLRYAIRQFKATVQDILDQNLSTRSDYVTEELNHAAQALVLGFLSELASLFPDSWERELVRIIDLSIENITQKSTYAL